MAQTIVRQIIRGRLFLQSWTFGTRWGTKQTESKPRRSVPDSPWLFSEHCSTLVGPIKTVLLFHAPPWPSATYHLGKYIKHGPTLFKHGPTIARASRGTHFRAVPSKLFEAMMSAWTPAEGDLWRKTHGSLPSTWWETGSQIGHSGPQQSHWSWNGVVDDFVVVATRGV